SNLMQCTLPYPLCLHDALPISGGRRRTPEATPRDCRRDDLSGSRSWRVEARTAAVAAGLRRAGWRAPDLLPGIGSRQGDRAQRRSEEHTSELQSREKLVCRLLL